MRAHKLLFVALAFVLYAGYSPVAHAATEEMVNGRLSGNWAGYVATREKFTGVGATWEVSSLAATTTLMTDVTWVGVGGSKTRDLIQAGTHSAVQNGKTQYWAWYELLPAYQQVIPLAVAAGDRISVSIVEISPGLWLMSFANLRSGETFYEAVEYRSRYSSAEWIQEMPVVYDRMGTRLYAPLSEFGTVAFEDSFAIVDGERRTLKDARARAVTLVSRLSKKVVLATPSDIVEDDSFSVARSGALPSPSSSKRSKSWEIVWSKGK